MKNYDTIIVKGNKGDGVYEGFSGNRYAQRFYS